MKTKSKSRNAEEIKLRNEWGYNPVPKEYQIAAALIALFSALYIFQGVGIIHF